MRWKLAQIVILATICPMAGKGFIHAQSATSTTVVENCPESSASDDQQPSGPEISIAEVTFSGAVQVPISEQDQIAALIKQRTRGNSIEGVTGEAGERARAGWQDRRYFKVQVSGEPRILTSSPVSQRIAISIHVDEGIQYSLGEITFKHNKGISDISALRSLFPIKDDDIFSPRKIAMGLENLQKAYGELGYLNFTSVPNTMFDDENKLISLEIDVDEGRQFYFSSVNVVGLDKRALQEILRDFPIGEIYSGRLWNQFLIRHSSILKFSPDDPRHIDRRLDEQAGTVAITIDARPCAGD